MTAEESDIYLSHTRCSKAFYLDSSRQQADKGMTVLCKVTIILSTITHSFEYNFFFFF